MTYRRNECLALFQLVGLVKEAREFVVFGIHAVYDAGEDHRPSSHHGLIARDL